MTNEEVEEHVRLFDSKHKEYKAYASALKALVAQLLRASNLEVVALESRAKSSASFREKITREGKAYKHPIQELTDLAGLRIITYQLSDIENVSKIIADNFTLDSANSVDKRQSLEADRFGYASVHYVVSISESRLRLPEYAALEGLKGEIQIRTVLQHAWAAIDHKLRYKSNEQIPADLRRQLYRISALLETADEQFESLTEGISNIRMQYLDTVVSGGLDLPLNVESLGAYVSNSNNAKSLLLQAGKLDIRIQPHHPNARLPEFSHLLSFLNHAGASDLNGFNTDLASISARYDAILKEIVDEWREIVVNENLRLVLSKDSLFRMMYFMSLPPGRANKLEDTLSFGPMLTDAIKKAYRKVHECANFKNDS